MARRRGGAYIQASHWPAWSRLAGASAGTVHCPEMKTGLQYLFADTTKRMSPPAKGRVGTEVLTRDSASVFPLPPSPGPLRGRGRQPFLDFPFQQLPDHFIERDPPAESLLHDRGVSVEPSPGLFPDLNLGRHSLAIDSLTHPGSSLTLIPSRGNPRHVSTRR